MSKIVAIVGRPNVGKSTLFNRLTGGRKAIVDDVSGVTRDRHYGMCEWNGQSFTVIDTGGYVPESSDIFESAIREQVKIAVDEAAVLIFMVDVNTEITDLDSSFAEILRKSGKPVIVVVNKVDTHNRIPETAIFYAFGFDNLFGVSAASGSGTGDLLDKVLELLHMDEEESAKEKIPYLAVIGRPNAGKSSFINALLGNERNIVTSVAGTTRDSIHTRYTAYNKDLMLIDTAGIRKKSKTMENIEFYSVMRSISALEECDVCFIMVDAVLGMESQDISLFWLAHRYGKGVIILVNKWDLVEKDNHSHKAFSDHIKKAIAPFDDVPIIFISALNKQRIFQALEAALEVYDNLSIKIKTSVLNDSLLPDIANTPPPSIKGKTVKIKYIQQLPSKGVNFAFFCNLPQYVNESYKRFLENRLRKKFKLTGVPIKIFFRKK